MRWAAPPRGANVPWFFLGPHSGTLVYKNECSLARICLLWSGMPSFFFFLREMSPRNLGMAKPIQVAKMLAALSQTCRRLFSVSFSLPCIFLLRTRDSMSRGEEGPVLLVLLFVLSRRERACG